MNKTPSKYRTVTSLCQQVIAKCPMFQIGSKLHINVLDIALSGYDKRTLSDCFLSILLESGGDAFVNKVGWTGYRPLNLVQFCLRLGCHQYIHKH